jgi:hypothetical protein
MTDMRWEKEQKWRKKQIEQAFEQERRQRQADKEGPIVYENDWGAIHQSAFIGLDDSEQTKFKDAMDNGPAAKQGSTGIKKMQGQANMYEIKVLGAMGGGRIYGDKRGSLIHFVAYSSSH